uniref:Secreted protein n=1 Tax=Panagrolaimus sp. PS1159 TaxID=55785 RepID=A0AC35FTX8_9BILA
MRVYVHLLAAAVNIFLKVFFLFKFFCCTFLLHLDLFFFYDNSFFDRIFCHVQTSSFLMFKKLCYICDYFLFSTPAIPSFLFKL